MRGKKHPDEVRAQAMAALLAGQGVNEVARDYDLPKATVSRLKSGLGEQLEQLEPKKSEQIEELLYGYLTSVLKTLKAQADVVADPVYIREQPADSLAVLHGVMADKGIRLLEAAERAKTIQPRQIER